jgi:hypothetical protein
VGVPEEDKKKSKESLNFKLINDFPKVLTNVGLEPKIVTLYQISSKTINDVTVKSTNGFDYAKATKVFFEFISRESLAALIEIIFKQVKHELIKLVAEIGVKIVKEQAKIKIKAIASIVTGVVEGVIVSIPTPNTSEFT